MTEAIAQMLPLLGQIQRDLDGDLSLAALARRAGRSPFELHRAFRRATGETAKRYTQRLRLERAAVELVRTRRGILEIALDVGFASHEVFTRAFLRRFGMSPRSYRARGLAGAGSAGGIAARHAAIVRAAGPCIGLHHMTRSSMTVPVSATGTGTDEGGEGVEGGGAAPGGRRASLAVGTTSPVTAGIAATAAAAAGTVAPLIVRRHIEARPALVIRKRIRPDGVAAALIEVLPAVFARAQQKGLPLAGPPFMRYVQVGLGSLVVEGGMPIAPSAAAEATAAASGEIEAIVLPRGAAAFAVHRGPYDRLPETHAAIEAWIEAQGFVADRGPWESYVTDPADHPDPSEWATEVYYPLA